MSVERKPSDVHASLYPEVAAGGFSRADGTIEFFQRINALLDSSMTVVDFGAGRGKSTDDPVRYRFELQRLRGKVDRVIGMDIDAAVLKNPNVDEAHVIRAGRPLPLPNETVDMVVSDFTFEHVTEPDWAAEELGRILRPGGWLCARTPNKWGYIGIPTRMVPNGWHVAVLRRIQPEKHQRDTFPTAYQMNTDKDLRHHFPPELYRHATYAMNNEPAYFGSSLIAWRLAQLTFRFTPNRFASVLYVFIQKRLRVLQTGA